MTHSHQTVTPYNTQMPAQPHYQPTQPQAYPGTGSQAAAQQSYYYQGDPSYYQYGAAEYGYPAADGSPSAPATGVGSWFEFSNSGYLKGFAIGAGATLLLTNPTVQRALVRGTVKLWSLVQGGVEEVKEQFQDMKAEMSQEE